MARVLTENQKKGLAYEAWAQMQLENTEYRLKKSKEIENIALQLSDKKEYEDMCKKLEDIVKAQPTIKTITTVNFTPNKKLSDKYFSKDFYEYYATLSWRNHSATITGYSSDDYKTAIRSYHESIKDKIANLVVLPYKNLDEKEVAMRAQVLSITHSSAEDLLAAIYEDCRNSEFKANEITYKK